MTVDLYQTPLRYGDAYDELSADGVTPRPHWAHLMESLRAIGPEELGRRWRRAERRIRENGITYNIYSDPLGANRPWKIDIVPFLIPADEWRFIEAGHHSARTAAEPDSRGSLRLAEPACEWAFSRRASLCQSRIPAADGGCARALAQLSSHARRRSCPLAGRPMVGACRSHAGSFGQRLCAGKPHHRLRCSAGSFPQLECPAARAVFPRAARCADFPRCNAAIRASCCSLPARTTRPTSSTRTSRATWDSRWSRERISPCATAASISRPSMGWSRSM